jgi:hypothetical protein
MFDFLKTVPLFANLPDDDLALLCKVVVEEHFPVNTPISGLKPLPNIDQFSDETIITGV